ncbi:MAG: A/G-specific adenine glycosylase [Coprobacter sp.]|nr:A/G-specific adenine glycosylase [Coprobacter sp.]
MPDVLENIPSISEPLIDWYEQNKRDLPWRETKDPYTIWISEIILQQTRVAQGYDYFVRFVSRFPDVQSLAEAPEDEVMKHWEGLGYYSRARNLQYAARQVMSEFHGVFPDTYEGVLSLKGVGEYTAAAVCSFAYGLPYAVLDGNVYRVMSRLFALDTPIDSGAGKKLFSELAASLLDRRQAATYNQAVMELGALVCTPRSPRCGVCPLSGKCLALSRNKTERFPVKQGKVVVKPRYFNYLHLVCGGTTWIHRRTGNDIWRNLYELVLIETEEEVSFEQLQAGEPFRRLMTGVGKIELRGVPVIRKHVLSHRIIYARFYTLHIERELQDAEAYIRVPSENLSDYVFSRLTLDYFDELEKQRQMNLLF